MDLPLDVPQFVAAFAFWSAAFTAGLWIARGTAVRGVQRRRATGAVAGHTRRLEDRSRLQVP